MQFLRAFLFASALALFAVACGGKQAPESTPEPAGAMAEDDEPAPAGDMDDSGDDGEE
jgi:hypothetical protein